MTYNRDLGSKKIIETRTIKKTDSVVDSTIDQFIKRADLGKNKYGVDLDREDLSLIDWIDHAIEEQMDNLLYLQKIRKMLGGEKR